MQNIPRTLKTLHLKKSQLENVQKSWADILLKKILRWQISPWKYFQHHPLGKCKLNHSKVPWHTHIKMIKTKTRTTSNADENQRDWIPHTCCWEGKIVQLLWKNVWEFLLKLNLKLSYSPAIALVGIYPRERGYSHAKICTWMFPEIL